MSYELDKLKREVDNLQFSKVDNWQFKDALAIITNLCGRVTHLENELSYILQRKIGEE